MEGEGETRSDQLTVSKCGNIVATRRGRNRASSQELKKKERVGSKDMKIARAYTILCKLSQAFTFFKGIKTKELSREDRRTRTSLSKIQELIQPVRNSPGTARQD